MESKNKNIIIGALLAVVLVMAVGFAAFSTSLNINGSAKITSTWDVHFDSSDTAKSAVAVSKGLSTGVAPTGSFTSLTATAATVTADLKQPGDTVTYTLTILNKGTLAAKLSAPTMSNVSGTTCSGTGAATTCTTTNDNIKFSMTAPASSSLVASTGSTTMTVKAEFVNKAANTNANGETGTVKITLNATQA